MHPGGGMRKHWYVLETTEHLGQECVGIKSTQKWLHSLLNGQVHNSKYHNAISNFVSDCVEAFHQQTQRPSASSQDAPPDPLESQPAGASASSQAEFGQVHNSKYAISNFCLGLLRPCSLRGRGRVRRGLCCGLCCVVLAAASSQDFTLIAASNCSTRVQGRSKSRRWAEIQQRSSRRHRRGELLTSRFREVTVRGNLSISRG